MSAVHHHHWHDFDRTHLRDTVLRLGAAVLVIIVVHAIVVYAALFWRKVEAGVAEPTAAVMIELAPIPVSVASEAETVPGPAAVQSPESTPDAPDIPEEAAPPPEPVVEQVVEKIPEVDPSPAPAEVVLPKAEPKKEEARERPKPKVERPKKEAKPTRRREAPVTAAAPRSEAETAQTTAAPSPGSAAIRSAALADWRSRAFSHLSRYKRPQAGHVGVPSITIALTGTGAVASVQLSRASGDEVVDREAVAMARRASPFPAPPEGKAFTFSVPIRFTQ
ncbi:energy transducer TonB [Xanthobacter dioxanivorans]|uniref:Energy transducer TonB n=1 Tax=Xanthobacter dioxanivorans TaxID=2528964 RepID=A0A974PKW7_9HYPH|nr:TonB family protein [Xanthobacter dioxanivorans]QRG05414.1 energy transducer TonB [Xanthobacter dioxanivorans]